MSITIQHPSDYSVGSVKEYKQDPNKKLQISASAIGKIIDTDQCPRYSRLRVDSTLEESILQGLDTRTDHVDPDETDKIRGWNDFNPLNSILANEGQRFENVVYEKFEKNSQRVIRNYRAEKDNDEDEDDLVVSSSKLEQIKQQILSGVNTAVKSTPDDDPIVMLQTPLSGIINEFSVVGYSDLIIVWPEEGSDITVRVIDIKASWSEKTSHQLQTATYTTLLRNVLDDYSNYYDHELQYTMEGGVLNRESEFAYPDKYKLPKFELQNREKDLQRMLSKNGDIYNSLLGNKEFENVEYQLDSVCKSCEYREICYADSYDRADIALLGLTRGEQKALRDVGITTVHQVADLANKQNKKPYKHEKADIKTVHKDTVEQLPTNLQLEIPRISQLAKEMLRIIDPDDPNAEEQYFLSEKTGVGPADIPDDTPTNTGGKEKLEYPAGKLIKVFVNVQEDYVTDRTILASATIDATNFESDPIQVSESIEDIPVDKENNYQFDFERLDNHEKQLLDNFSTKVLQGIKTVGRALNEYPDASVHFYFYTENEYTRLIDSLKRYENSNDTTDAFQDLLSLREGAEQQIYSILQKELQKLYHIDQLPDNLISMNDRLYANTDNCKVTEDDMTYIDSDHTTINLRKEFYTKLYDYKEKYEHKEHPDDDTKQTPFFKFRESKYKDSDSQLAFSVESRGSSIPLEYMWGCKEIDILSPDWIEQIKENQAKLLSEDKKIEEEFTKNIEQLSGAGELFRHIQDGTKRRKLEHVEALSLLFTLYARNIEDAIFYKSQEIEKPKLNIANIEQFNLQKSFEETVKDYVKIEQQSSKDEIYAHYQKAIEERIQTGKSVPIKVTDIIEQNNVVIKADLAYSDLGFSEPELMAASFRKSDATNEWMTASVLEKLGDQFIEQNGSKPKDIIRSPEVVLHDFNTNDMTVELKETFSQKYTDSFVGPSEDATEHYEVAVEPGDYLIVDPTLSTYLAETSLKALNNANTNATNNLVKSLLSENATLQTDQYQDTSQIRKFIRWMRKVDNSITFKPNRKQKRFIKDLSSKVHLLQGPPGTGKTSGAIASALTGRIYAAEKEDSKVRGIVTGPSHTSIDEITTELSELIQGYNENSEDDITLDNVDIVRVNSGTPETEQKDNVEYVDYNKETDIATVNRILQQLETTGLNTETVQDTLYGSQNHTIILTTPVSLHGLMKNYAEELDITDIYHDAPKLFDIMCVDEASMLTIDKLLVSGAFMSENGQWLIAGDHRQMPPVQKFEWDAEKRSNIEQYLPYLSTLNYFRFLRGDNIEDFIEDDDILEKYQPSNTNIEKTGLEITYRCHTKVAEFLKEWVYDKDNINYRSNQTTVLPEITKGTEGVQKALNNEKPITLIVHDDTKSKQFNPVEAEIVSALNASIPESESTGIVTPHNAQKGYLKSVDSSCAIDTVERFQGGQKDAMMISATVSDPNYLSSESDFIFDPRRINVAISRMKKKLLIVAPQSLFNFIPDDVDLYEDASIWAGLYEEVNGEGDSSWSGNLSEFTGKTSNLDANISVYHSD